MAIEPSAAHGALDAFARYGKGTQHPAQLNLGDCFACSQARSLGAALLFRGDDFVMTDIPGRSLIGGLRFPFAPGSTAGPRFDMRLRRLHIPGPNRCGARPVLGPPSKDAE